jgi:hypothetical protein
VRPPLVVMPFGHPSELCSVLTLYWNQFLFFCFQNGLDIRMQRDFDSSTPAKLIMLCENTIEQQIKQEEKRVITMILKKEGIKTSYVTLTFLSEIEFMIINLLLLACGY